MDYDVHVEAVESHSLAVVRRTARLDELSKVVPEACGEVWDFIRSHKIARPGRNVALYLDDIINLEVGVEVSPPFVGDECIIPSATPAGTVAAATHWGEYGQLVKAHVAIRAWCNDRALKIVGPNWEIYGHWHDDPLKRRTDVFYLVEAY